MIICLCIRFDVLISEISTEFGVTNTIPLIRNGEQTAVTKENRLQYIYLVSNYRLNRTEGAPRSQCREWKYPFQGTALALITYRSSRVNSTDIPERSRCGWSLSAIGHFRHQTCLVAVAYHCLWASGEPWASASSGVSISEVVHRTSVSAWEVAFAERAYVYLLAGLNRCSSLL